MDTQLSFSGFFSNSKKFNPGNVYKLINSVLIVYLMNLYLKMLYVPDFYDWNRIKVRYCDGSSFTGDVEAVDPVSFTSSKEYCTVNL